MNRHLWSVVLLTACAVPAHSQESVLGLLSLPQVYGAGPCSSYEPSAIPLYRDVRADRPYAEIQVTRPLRLHAGGGCDGLEVHVRSLDSGALSDFPVFEAGYEEPAAVVVGREGDWFRIRLADGAAWLRADAMNEFFPLETLLHEALTYIAEPDGRGLAAAAGGERAHHADLVSRERVVTVMESARVNGALWLRVAVLGQSPCESLGDPPVVAEGWLPAHTATGEPLVWFYSRGC